MFTVLLPVYIGDNKENLDEAIKSLLSQTVMPEEILVVCDGEIQQDVRSLLDGYKNRMTDLFTLIHFRENRGIGKALNEGVKKARNDIIARMDADDISVRDRFEKQLPLIEREGYDAAGSQIIEFEGDKENWIGKRTVPCRYEDIARYAKRRNPFNHMSMIFKRKSALDAGGYIENNGFEDYYLWVRMIQKGAKLCNLGNSLVLVRAGKQMMARRRGQRYIRNEIDFQKELHRIKFISLSNMCFNIAGRTAVRLFPLAFLHFIYRNILRKKV